MKAFPSEFRNVDLDIKSASDPAVLLNAWGRRVLRMHVDRFGRRYWLRLILRGPEAKSPSEAIRRFAKLVGRLSRRDRQVWSQASREFDIGVDAGWEHRTGEWVLDAETMQIVAALGASVRLTVYSPLSLVEETTQKPRRLGRKK